MLWYFTLCYTVLLYYTILYYTILYYTILYYTILYYTILYYNILYYIIQYCTTLHYTILYCTIVYYTALYYTILYYTTLHYTILYYTILYYTILSDHSSRGVLPTVMCRLWSRNLVNEEALAHRGLSRQNKQIVCALVGVVINIEWSCKFECWLFLETNLKCTRNEVSKNTKNLGKDIQCVDR
jgi:hypothetical protein